MPSASAPQLPIPISRITDRYLLFDIQAVTWLRREHHICGVLIGTIPQAPQQNIFQGLPLELMPEEARLLVERGIAYIIDDARLHSQVIHDLKDEDRKRYLSRLRGESQQFSKMLTRRKEQRRDRTLRQNREISSGTPPSSEPSKSAVTTNGTPSPDLPLAITTTTPHPPSIKPLVPRTLALTPTTSQYLISPPFPLPPAPPSPISKPSSSTAISSIPIPIPSVSTSSSYPLFAHLHDRGYFLAPGLRFGCHYLVYPGDPLRFHSHFLGVGLGWDDEIDLMDIVGGGRLGTGVKKGFLVGGLVVDDEVERREKEEREEKGEGNEKRQEEDKVRTWSLEWAAM